MRRGQFLRGSPPGQNNHRVVRHSIFPSTSPAVPNVGLIDGHDSTQAQASFRPTNNYPSRHVATEAGDNLATHRGASEESWRMSQLVSGSIPLFAPLADVAHFRDLPRFVLPR